MPYIEKRLLCLNECGCYISIHDIITLAQALGLALPYKKRSLTLQTLLEATSQNKHMLLIENLCILLNAKKNNCFNVHRSTRMPQTLLALQISKIEATKSL